MPGAGTALVADNLISEARAGAIVGMHDAVTGDLAKAGSEQYANVMVSGNRVR